MAQNPSKISMVKFSVEKLDLHCEWEDCTVFKNDIEDFISHISNEHIMTLPTDDLHCHWKDCEGFTENFSELRRHILLHALHAKLKCHGTNLINRKNLPGCSASFRTHNIIPELPEPLLCGWEECFFVYECAEHFYRHVDTHAKYDSKKNDTFACFWQDCGRTFGSNGKIKEHLRSHTQEKLVACPTCGGMFASRTKFIDHIQRQLAESESEKSGPYNCEYCSKKMSTERLLRDHMRHHVNNYKCPFCDMTCPTPSSIANHVSYRHSESKPHACDVCDYKSKTESDLRKHLESHSLVPSYKCPVESCVFSSRSQSCYRAHYRKQHEQKDVKYSCHLCEKMFTRGNYLTKHLIKVHKFRWPSGHCRFRYVPNEEGLYKLQTVRYESLELSQEMMGEDIEDEDIDNPDSCSDMLESVPESNNPMYSEESLETEFTDSRCDEPQSDNPSLQDNCELLGLESYQIHSDGSVQDSRDIAGLDCNQFHPGSFVQENRDSTVSECYQLQSDSSVRGSRDINSLECHRLRDSFVQSIRHITSSESKHSQYDVSGQSNDDIVAPGRYNSQNGKFHGNHEIATSGYYQEPVNDNAFHSVPNPNCIQVIQEASTVRIQEGSVLMDTNLIVTRNPGSVQLRIVDVQKSERTTFQSLLKADLDSSFTAVQAITKDSQGMVVFETVEIPTV